MLIEKFELPKYESESRKEMFRCGRIRSSDEIAVMGMEQRNSIILTSEI
ncbi:MULTISPECIES: hypothetical protein [Clostridium]|uniref:Uncharacterized protein n=1 Tax=Clostridium ragsdalei P11 TaxID=1353534 RepID=A0A1A6AKX4_9CLOT|nr:MULTISPECIES: hypothetical protein [Clostridium]OBR90735.1 hypothetical protein CLRAG_33830 [Clostridium ragsdalei P11]